MHMCAKLVFLGAHVLYLLRLNRLIYEKGESCHVEIGLYSY
jgi:hypothetical protein